MPAQGSVGYLTHMAHVGIALLGIGEVSYRGSVVPAAAALAAEGLATVRLGAKDGLCLVNGTPCMTGLACLALDDAQRLAQWADVIGAMSFEALRANWRRSTPRSLRSSRIPGCSGSPPICEPCWLAARYWRTPAASAPRMP